MSLFELRKAIESQMASIDLSVQTKSITALLQLFSESLLSGVNQVDSYDRHSRTLVKLAPYYLFDNRGNYSGPSFHRPYPNSKLPGFESLFLSQNLWERVKRRRIGRHRLAFVSPDSANGITIIVKNLHIRRNDKSYRVICDQLATAITHGVSLDA